MAKRGLFTILGVIGAGAVMLLAQPRQEALSDIYKTLSFDMSLVYKNDDSTAGIAPTVPPPLSLSPVAQTPNNSIHPTKGTVPNTPLGQMNEFLEEHPNSAGARFIHLLRRHVHPRAGAENERMDACQRMRKAVDPTADAAHCYTGTPNATSMPLNSSLTPQEMPIYLGTDRTIPALGTQPTCLPLFLAGSTVGPASMAIELGPYFGLSSKCIVAGMQTQGVRENAYLAFDTFDNRRNYNSIKNNRHNSWILKENPFYNETNTSFLFMWERAVLPVYPTARGRPGWITNETLNWETIGSPARGIDLISIDSAKSITQLFDQLGGLNTLKAGTILFLLDFEYVRTQVQWVFGCLRHSGYLLPVHTAWAKKRKLGLCGSERFDFGRFSFSRVLESTEARKGSLLDRPRHPLFSLAERRS